MHPSRLLPPQLLLILMCVSGCQPGRPSQWAVTNPFAKPPPAYKRQYGLTPAQKIERLQQLATRGPAMAPEEQIRVCAELRATLASETDVMIRRQLVATLAAIPTAPARAGLYAALSDPEPSVRVAACRAVMKQPDSQTVSAVGRLLAEDADPDVRLAVYEALGACRTQEAIGMLSAGLDEPDPVLRQAVFHSLRSATGQAFGNDAERWRAFAGTRQPPPSKPANSAASAMASDAAAAR
jgi:hypothetical protein